MNGLLPKRGRRKPEYPEKTPNNQSENQHHVRSENSPSNIGDKFAWSERTGSNPWYKPYSFISSQVDSPIPSFLHKLTNPSSTAIRIMENRGLSLPEP